MSYSFNSLDGGPGPPNYKLQLLLLLISGLWNFTLSEKNAIYDVTTICNQEFMPGIYRQVDGAILMSGEEMNLDCTMTFQTRSVMQRFMVRFDKIRLDCTDHIYLYDSANVVGNYKAHVSCRNSTTDFGIMFTGTNFITVRFIADQFYKEGDGFEFVMTGFKDPSIQVCNDFQCSYKNLCISKDLVCDGIDHCMDSSDEIAPSPCPNGKLVRFSSTTLMLFVTAGVVLFLVILLCIAVTLLCRRKNCSSSRARLTHSHNSATNIPLESMRGANGTGGSVGYLVEDVTIIENDHHVLPRKDTTLNIHQGNGFHPASLKLGYSEVRVPLYSPGE